MKLRNILRSVMALAICGVVALSAGCAEKSSIGNTDEINLVDGDQIAVLEIEGYGTIKAKLFPDIAPTGVKNFVDLCSSGYYEGKNIHRVIADFMFQGGSENGDGTGGAAADGTKFSIETSDTARHFYGALCYANAGKDENTCQFYIVNSKKSVDLDEQAAYYKKVVEEYKDQLSVKQTESFNAIAERMSTASQAVKDKYKAEGGTPTLDGDYTVFGQVIEGFDVIDAISSCEVEEGFDGAISKPVEDIIIKSAKVETYTAPVETQASEESKSK